MKYIIGFLILFLFTACDGANAVTPAASSPTESAEIAIILTTNVPTTLPATPTVMLSATPLPLPTVTSTPTSIPILQSDGDSWSPEISDNGRYIAFISRGKLTENANHDALYVYDRETEQIELASVALDGKSSEGRPFNIALSSSGRYVGFHSHGSDMVSGDDELCDSGMSNCADLFIYDRQLKSMMRIPLGIPTGEGVPFYPWVTFSPDERFFYSDSQYYDLNTNEPVSPKPTTDYLLPNRWTVHFWDSKEGDAEEGKPEGSLNGYEVVKTGNITGGGTLVAFSSWDTDITDNPISQCEDFRYSEEGLRPCFNIFVHSLETSETWLASVGTDERSSNGDTSWPKMSANGRYLTFASFATNLTDDDFSFCHNEQHDCNNVFLHDLEKGETILISREFDNKLPAGYSRVGDVSDDGRFVTFSSGSDKLVHDDTNGVDDVFVYDRLTEKITRISVPNSP